MSRRQPKLAECRASACRNPARGLDGFCVPCSRARERAGLWRTPPLDEQPLPERAGPTDAEQLWLDLDEKEQR